MWDGDAEPCRTASPSAPGLLPAATLPLVETATAQDREAIERQLGRPPRALAGVAARCDMALEFERELGLEHWASEAPPMEGVSLMRAFRGEALDRGRPIFFEHEGNRAVREGKWKLVAKTAKGKWELYDMDADRSEVNDLAASDPETLERRLPALLELIEDSADAPGDRTG